jgi:pimeloyl-ACP methyl ester carboxylesterase
MTPTVDRAGVAESWRAPELGRRHEVRTRAGRVCYFESGEGPAVVFAHGWLANANLWRKVVPRLAARWRCLVLDLPFGSHGLPADEGADLTPPGCGALINDALDAVAPDDVTLVGNDSGGAYAQIAAAARPERLCSLVLASCETPYDTFPPARFAGLKEIARTDETLGSALQALRSREFRRDPRAYGLLAKRPIEDAASDSYALPALGNGAVLRDAGKAMRSASETHVRAAGEALIAGFEKPVLLAWAAEDPVFPVEHARMYARCLKQAKLDLIDDAFSFTPEDRPEQLADVLDRFLASSRTGAAAAASR